MRVETIYALYTQYISALYTHYIRTISALLTLGMRGAWAGWRAGPVRRQDLALLLGKLAWDRALVAAKTPGDVGGKHTFGS